MRSSVTRAYVPIIARLPLEGKGSRGIAVMDLFELVAESAGIEVGGSTGAAAVAQEGTQ